VHINVYCIELLHLGYNQSFFIDECAGDQINSDFGFGELKETAMSFTIFYFNIKILNNLK
jgi:hypothetical protein